MYSSQKLDAALLIMDPGGALSAGEQIEDPDMYQVYQYLKAKGLVYTREAVGDKIIGAGLTEKGNAFITEGGFIGKEKKAREEKEYEKQQRRNDRSFSLWMVVLSGVLGLVFGVLGTLIVLWLTK